MRLIRGYEAFKETNFRNLRCLCNNYLVINQIKLCLCFEKLYDFFLSFIAVFNKPLHNRRLSLRVLFASISATCPKYLIFLL